MPGIMGSARARWMRWREGGGRGERVWASVHVRAGRKNRRTNPTQCIPARARSSSFPPRWGAPRTLDGTQGGDTVRVEPAMPAKTTSVRVRWMRSREGEEGRRPGRKEDRKGKGGARAGRKEERTWGTVSSPCSMPPLRSLRRRRRPSVCAQRAARMSEASAGGTGGALVVDCDRSYLRARARRRTASPKTGRHPRA